MDGGLPALAVAAGMLAAVNPCGFALLPAYLSLLISGVAGGPVPPGRARSVVRALSTTAAMTTGFAAVFAVFGLAVAPVAAGAQRHLPWFTVVLGVALVGLGLAMLAGRSVTLPRLPGRRGPARELTGSFWSVAVFGAGYALASLTCTVAPFLAVVVGGFRAGSLLDGLVLFLAYAAGMGLVVGTVAVSTALASGAITRRLRGFGAWMPRVAGGLLVLAGAYVAYYAAWELRVLRGGGFDDPVVAAAAQVQQTLARWVAAPGPLGWLLVGVVVVLAALAWGRVRGRRSERVRDAGAGPEADRVRRAG